MNAALLSEIASGVGLWPGLLLLAAGPAKLRDVARGERLRRTALGRLLPDRLPLPAVWGLAGAAELAVGALVVAGLLPPWPAAAAALVLAAAGLVAVWALRRAPDAGCGCLGARSAPVSPRTALRAGTLAALAAVAAAGGEAWWSALGSPVAALTTAAAGVAVAWLSPDLREGVRGALTRGATPARRLRSAACRRVPVPVERTAARLRGSELWLRARPYIAADAPSEHWREGCWTLMCYPAVYEGREATAVFAVGLRGSARTVAFVDEQAQRVLGRLEARA